MSHTAGQLRTIRRFTLTLIAAAALSAWPAFAQTTTATVQGAVTDTSGAALPAAMVTVRDVNTGFTRATTTDRTGHYVLPSVPAGTYALTVELAGFKTHRREGLALEVGQELTIDSALEIGGVTEMVTVRETAPLVEPTKTALDKVITRTQIDNLPLSGRQASSLALLAPGVVSRGDTQEPVTAQGQPRGSGETLIDGVSNEAMAVNSVRSNAPPDAIQEFQVLTTQYAAEFGNASGIILNTITRSGTNAPHGRVYYFHRDEAWDARNAFSFAPEKPTFEQKQGGGWFGAPIVKDRTQYFVAYEGTRQMTTGIVTSPAGPGEFEKPYDNNQLLAKVTHQMTPQHTVTGRFSFDRPFFHNQFVGGNTLNENGVENLSEDRSYVGTLASVLSNRALNEIRFQGSRRKVRIDAKNPNAYSFQRPTAFGGKPANQPQAFPEVRFQLVDNFTYERGAHRLKFGVDVSRVDLEGYVYQYNPGHFVFATDLPFDPNNPATYPSSFLQNQGDVNFAYAATGVALFAQDAWRLPRDLTLNVGVRYDGWSMGGLDLQKANVAPRLGFAWDPLGTGKTSVRGGYGVFYSNTMFNVALLANWLGKQRVLVIASPGYPDPFSRGIPAGTIATTYISQPDQPLPRSYNTTIGVQREVWRGLSVSADYVNAKGRKLIRIVESNPLTPPSNTRRDPTKGAIGLLESSGYSNYDALLVGVTSRSTRGLIGAAYTLSSYKATTDTEAAAVYQDDLTPNDSYGYGAQDQRHRLVLHGTVNLPWQFQAGAILAARSGTPFNITTGRDNNRNTLFTDRPDLAPGARVGTSDMSSRASFIDAGTRPGNLPRNAGRGPNAWTLDLRLANRLPVKGKQVEVLLEAFNATNQVNFNNPVGNLASGSFGRSTSAGDARQVQLGFRFEF